MNTPSVVTVGIRPCAQHIYAQPGSSHFGNACFISAMPASFLYALHPRSWKQRHNNTTPSIKACRQSRTLPTRSNSLCFFSHQHVRPSYCSILLLQLSPPSHQFAFCFVGDSCLFAFLPTLFETTPTTTSRCLIFAILRRI